MDGQAQVPGCTLSWALTDLTPPWVSAPETIVMHHGIGATRDIFAGWLPGLIATHRILRSTCVATVPLPARLTRRSTSTG